MTESPQTGRADVLTGHGGEVVEEEKEEKEEEGVVVVVVVMVVVEDRGVLKEQTSSFCRSMML